MWVYLQRTGQLYNDSPFNLAGTGYSGHRIGKNNPELQHVKNVGPIPCGYYTFDDLHDSDEHGPYVFRLIPEASNEMFDRDALLCHGDSVKHPGEASEGCIVQLRAVRVKMWAGGDHRLAVFRDMEHYMAVLNKTYESKEGDL